MVKEALGGVQGKSGGGVLEIRGWFNDCMYSAGKGYGTSSIGVSLAYSTTPPLWYAWVQGGATTLAHMRLRSGSALDIAFLYGFCDCDARRCRGGEHEDISHDLRPIHRSQGESLLHLPISQGLAN